MSKSLKRVEAALAAAGVAHELKGALSPWPPGQDGEEIEINVASIRERPGDPAPA